MNVNEINENEYKVKKLRNKAKSNELNLQKIKKKII